MGVGTSFRLAATGLNKPMTEDQQTMIDDCERRSAKLTDWESQFIDSLSRRDFLTDAQDAKLNEIWDRVTEDG